MFGSETFPARAHRLLGGDIIELNATNSKHWMAVRDEHAKFSDDQIERELRWIIQHGYRWRPAPAPVDAAACSRIIATMHAMRQQPGLYGGAASVESLCAIGEGLISNSQDRAA